mgnify:CR=1 FL=1
MKNIVRIYLTLSLIIFSECIYTAEMTPVLLGSANVIKNGSRPVAFAVLGATVGAGLVVASQKSPLTDALGLTDDRVSTQIARSAVHAAVLTVGTVGVIKVAERVPADAACLFGTVFAVSMLNK